VGTSSVRFHFASVVTKSRCILISKEYRLSDLMECTTIAFECFFKSQSHFCSSSLSSALSFS
jgi:hypothetical protein